MAYTGLKYMVAAKLDESAAEDAYTGGTVIGRSISANVTVESAEGSLFSEDELEAYITKVTGASITIGTSDLKQTVRAFLLGHTLTGSLLKYKNTDIAPYVGHGFYGEATTGEGVSYIAVWLYKVRFKDPVIESETKNDSISFKTPSIAGKAIYNRTGELLDLNRFETESEAVAWLNGLAGITE